tara:strand:+ start:342 stop:596 length:255 start_codon:yes stop_codon:yes gene_type:complete
VHGQQVVAVNSFPNRIGSTEGFPMFKWLKKSPLEKLQREYQALRIEARDLQRKGDIRAFAAISAEAEKLSQRMDILEQSGESND